jgi:hypothetical protein
MSVLTSNLLLLFCYSVHMEPLAEQWMKTNDNAGKTSTYDDRFIEKRA